MRILMTRKYLIGDQYLMNIHGDSSLSFDIIGLIPNDGIMNITQQVCAELFVLTGRTLMRCPPGFVLLSDNRGLLELSQKDSIYIDWHGKAQAMISSATGRAIVNFPNARGLNKEFLSKKIIRPVIDRLLERSFLLLHGAGAAFAGAALIIAGRAGAGKTTLLTQLIGEGFDYLADDRVMTGLDDSCMIYRYPEHISLSRTSRGKKIRTIPPISYSSAARPACIVILEPGNDSLKVVSMSSAETAARLVRHVICHDSNLWQRNFDAVANLCGKSRGYLISGWGDKGERLEKVLELNQLITNG